MVCVTQNRLFPANSSRGFLISIVVASLFSLGILGPAGPPTAEAAPATDEEGFRFELTPYLWLSGLKGDVRIRRLGTEVDADFKDLLDHLDLGGAFVFEAGKGNWSGWFDGFYVRLKEGAERERVSIGAVVEASIIDGAIAYRIAEGPAVDVYAGVRRSRIDVEFELKPLVTLDGHESWVDPIVGARFLWELTDRWFAGIKFDMGGFGMGSDFTWNAQAGIGYRFTEHISLKGSYRYLSIDYDEDDFVYDTDMNGFQIGLGISW
jgi:hypothetical protein